jgi:hypothetical protein
MLSTKHAKDTPVRKQQNINIVSLPTENIQTILLAFFRDDFSQDRDGTTLMREAFVSAWRLSVTCSRMRSAFIDILDRMCSSQCRVPDILFAKMWIIRGASQEMVKRELIPGSLPRLTWGPPLPVHPFMADAFTGSHPITIHFSRVDFRALGRVIMLCTAHQWVIIEDCLFAHSDITILSQRGYFTLRNSRHGHHFNPQGDEAVTNVRFTFHNAEKIDDSRDINHSMTVCNFGSDTIVERSNHALGIREEVLVRGENTQTVFRTLAGGQPYQTSTANTWVSVYIPGMLDDNGPTDIHIAHEDTRINIVRAGCIRSAFTPPVRPTGPGLVPAYAEFHAVEGSRASIDRFLVDADNGNISTYHAMIAALRSYMTVELDVTVGLAQTPLIPVYIPVSSILSLGVTCDALRDYMQQTVTEAVAREFFRRNFNFTDAFQTPSYTRINFEGACPSMDIVDALMPGHVGLDVEYYSRASVVNAMSPEFLTRINNEIFHSREIPVATLGGRTHNGYLP